MGGRTRLPFVGLLPPATINRSPSSMREVSVRPSAAALRLARSSRSSGSRTVVRPAICHDISLKWPYVNARRGLKLVAHLLRVDRNGLTLWRVLRTEVITDG